MPIKETLGDPRDSSLRGKTRLLSPMASLPPSAATAAPVQQPGFRSSRGSTLEAAHRQHHFRVDLNQRCDAGEIEDPLDPGR